MKWSEVNDEVIDHQLNMNPIWYGPYVITGVGHIQSWYETLQCWKSFETPFFLFDLQTYFNKKYVDFRL